MESTILIKHIETIEVGKVEQDFMSGCFTPNFNTYMEGEEWILLMTYFNFDLMEDETFTIRYLLTTFYEETGMEQYLFEFDASSIGDEQQEFYQMKEIKY